MSSKPFFVNIDALYHKLIGTTLKEVRRVGCSLGTRTVFVSTRPELSCRLQRLPIETRVTLVRLNLQRNEIRASPCACGVLFRRNIMSVEEMDGCLWDLV